MRILEVIPQMGYGGAERLVVDLSNFFVDRGHSVCLTLFHSPDTIGNPSFLRFLHGNVEITVIEKRRGVDFRLSEKLRKHSEKWSADLMHTHLDALPYAYSCRVPVVHTLHNSPMLEAAGIFRRTIRRLLFRSGRVSAVGCSAVSACEASAYYGIICEPIANGRSPIPFPETVESSILRRRTLSGGKWGTLIVNIATTSPVKGQLHLARAVAAINRSLPSGRCIRMAVVGQTRADYVRLIEEAAEGSALIAGTSDHPEKWIAASDAMVISSLREGLPITLLEAMGYGKPCVSTPAGGVREVIADGENGILADGFGTADIASALRRFIDMTPEQLLRMGRSARATSVSHSIERCGAHYETLFRSLLAKRK